MRFDSEAKSEVYGICIHLELIMYGDAFLDVKRTDEGMTVNWLSLCDGGELADKGEKSYPTECFASVVDSLYDLDFPEQGDKDMNPDRCSPGGTGH